MSGLRSKVVVQDYSDELWTRELLWECGMNRLLGQTLSVLPKSTATFLFAS